MNESWEIRSEIIFPLAQVAIGKDGGFPDKMEFKSRYISSSTITVDGTELSFEKWRDQPVSPMHNVKGQFCESVALVCQISAENKFLALEAAMSSIEWACDQLAFFTQFPISIVSIEIRKVGDPENRQLFPKPPQPAKFRSAWMNNTRVPLDIPLWPKPGHIIERDLAALRWYHKALAAEYEVDRFVFLWICLEVLCASSQISVCSPYKAKCGHIIATCPECGESTEKEVMGKTLQEYLKTRLRVSEEDAEKLWQYRQLLHGANKLSEKSTKDMERLIMILQSAVNLGLKERLGLAEDGPPVVFPTGVAISALSLGLKIQPKDP
ncbi:hypothetical protein IMZ48_00275 [Candidatus Bathyarchaeota archaeon]|nr:hypothetical protein [Candidatus Bathyarchaeota archaeon]